MNPSREEALLALALEKSSGERAAFLARECASDTALRRRVEALLVAHDQAVGSSLTQAGAPTVLDPSQPNLPAQPADEAEGALIGRYKLLEKLGEGGFGAVWLAEQKEPVRRKVALKIIKLGMDTKQVVARFEAERQALAMMDHPNIAKVLDAGTTANGRPYFVMELVRGIPITKYCDENNLPTDERLSLFTQVCHAIQHAHQKGIIHRDIKPSNILVTLHDSAPVPKVIDFGIAKATQGELTDKTVYTQLNQFIGTPAYMSPEQAEMSGLDIDTRSDIYSLGVLLYELLVGKTPFDAKQLLEAGLDAMRKTIREQEPVRPSTRLSSMMGEEKTTTAKRRGADIPKLITLLRGDLDWIVMKCLEKDRTRRYETANGLAADINRHLSNEPVAARPPSRIYKLQKFARRNKATALAAAVVVFALILGLGSSTLALLRERQAHRIANDARAAAVKERQSAEAARARAEENALTARRNAYAADMFAAQQAFENSNLGRARDLLKAHWPKPGEPDLRDFEWRYLWHLCQGDNFHTFPEHSESVSCVAFSPDGQTLASGGGKLVKLWDISNRRLVATLSAQTNHVTWLAFSNDGARLATLSVEGLITLWDVKTHQLIDTLEEKGAARVAFSPVEKFLAISYGGFIYADQHGGPIKLWNYVTRQFVKSFPNTGSRMAFSPDGKTLAARSGYDAVKLWNVENGQELLTLDNAGNVLCLSFSSDGQTLAASTWDGEVNLWNVAKGARRLQLQGHTTQVWGLAFSPDGRMLATGSTDQTVRFWNVATGKEEWKLIGHGSEVRTLAFAPDGKTLATGGKDAMVMLWSTAPKPAEVMITNVHLPPSFSSDNKLLATCKFGGPVTVLGVATRQPVWVLSSERFAQFVSGTALATLSSNRVLRFWNVTTHSLLREVPLPGITDSARSFRLALCGERLAVADEDDVITLYDTGTGGVIWKFKANAGYIHDMRFSLDGRLLATTGDGQPLKLWDVATQKELAAESSHQGQAQGLAFSPDGSVLASASYDDTVGFLRVATSKAEASITGIKEGCSGVTFSLDGRTLAVACEDGTVRLWNLATRREVAVLKHGKLPLWFVVFSSDGQTLVSVCEDGTMRFWNAPSPEAPQPGKE